jgi:hypothetical protein
LVIFERFCWLPCLPTAWNSAGRRQARMPVVLAGDAEGQVFDADIDVGLPSIEGTVMNLLRSIVRGLHMAIGIHTPPPEQETLYVYVWIGIILSMIAGLMLLFYLLG